MRRAAHSERCNRQNGATQIGSHGTRRWGRHDRVCDVPLDRRGNQRTCQPVADEHGRTDRVSPAPPRAAICGRQSGCSRKACCKVRTPNIPIREDGERAPTYRKSGSCCRRHKSTAASRLQSCSILELDQTRCHWPLGESTIATEFCGGAAVPGRRYCPHQLRMARYSFL